MLVRLTTSQAQEHWPLIRNGIGACFPDEGPEFSTHVLELLGSEDLVCWIVMAVDRPLGFCITSICTEIGSEDKYLLLYAIYAFPDTDVNPKIWSTSLGILRRYALSESCKRIEAFTDNRQVIEIAKNLGAKTRCYLVWRLDGGTS